MKNIFCRLLLSVFFICGILNADIYQSSNLLPIEEALEEAGQDTLVIFDIVDTLITCDEPLFHSKNKNAFGKVSDEFFQNMSKERVDELMTTILNERKTSLVDSKILDLLDIVREKDLKVLLVTSCGTGKYGLIDKMEDWRIRQLELLGLHFEDMSIKDEKWFDTMQGPHGIPLLKKGVVFTAKMDKAIVLEELFKTKLLKPKSIIFVDDQLKNLSSVEAFCKKRGVSFLGFEYTAVKERAVQKVDEKLIEIQLNILLNEGQWVTSEEAAETFNDEQS